MPNRNTQWTEIFVDELARSGLMAVCIAPGSRNTPLTLAFARHPTIRAYSHLDERSAGFFALGLAQASQKVVALVCTSGTALANFYPAVIEAHQSQIPLLVLSGDRPPELRHSGANQTIDQLKIYGDMVRWFVDMALPEQQPSAVSIRNLRTLANRAIATAKGMPAGVVHLNFPFRKPLEPIPLAGDEMLPDITPAHPWPHTQIAQPSLAIDLAQIGEIAHLLEKHPRGLIIVGLGKQHAGLAEAIHEFSQKTGYPILADALSGVRFNGTVETISTYDNFLPLLETDPVQIVIRFGKLPLSKAINTYLGQTDFEAYIHIASEDGIWADDTHKITHFIPTTQVGWLTTMNTYLATQADLTWRNIWQTYEQMTRRAVQEYLQTADDFEGGVVADVIARIPDNSTIFVGNSLPVRHLDQFGFAGDKPLKIYANRGASGIDGLVSTALGCGVAHPENPLVLIIGDISLYHDMNGLLAIQRLNIPVTIVLLNNDGGGIFNRLPIRDFEPEFTEWFLTPHGLDFAHTAALYGLDYMTVASQSDFREVFSASVTQNQATLIDVKTDATRAEEHRQMIYSLLVQEFEEYS